MSLTTEMEDTGTNITVLIDNYDSFTWNVYQYLTELGAQVEVFRNDKITIDKIAALNPKNLVISPGPGQPLTDSGISCEVISHFSGKIPILGICMGEQCIFEVFGGKVDYAGEIVHGKTSTIEHDSVGLFINVPKEISATRYHSLAAQPSTIPDELMSTCWSDTKVLMGIRHREFTIEGIQFHPESILSEHGKTLLGNFLNLKGGTWDENPEFKVKPPLAKTKVKEDSVSSILEKIVLQRYNDVEAAKKQPGSSPYDLKRLLSLHIAPPLIDFPARLSQNLPKYPAIMAEVKRASPSKGNIDLTVNAAEQALIYAKAGASVISVLTEPKWFKGSLDDMRQAHDILSSIPNRPAVLRKDFIIDTYQIMEARIYGADTVLLIVAILDDEKLAKLYNFAKSLGMEPLVEVNSEEEMKRAIKLGAKVIGVNNRNLHTFEVDLSTTSRLAKMVHKGIILVALSGINSRMDVTGYIEQGIGALLIGEAMMKAQDKKAFIDEILGIEKVETKTTITKSPIKPLVKICGINTIDAAITATELGADLIGLIFAKNSRRKVTLDLSLEIVNVIREMQSDDSNNIKKEDGESEENVNYLESLPSNYDWFRSHANTIYTSKKPLIVGVFQDQSVEYITKIVQYLKLDLIQLHGNEPLDMPKFLPRPVIKTFHIDENFCAPTLITQPGYHQYCLLDTKTKNNKDAGQTHEGGSGISFDWNIALKIKNSVKNSKTGKVNDEFPIILAGGLNPENVKEAIEKVKPWCVDVSSGVETDQQKDNDKIKEFIQRAKSIIYKDEIIETEEKSQGYEKQNGESTDEHTT
ncbi:10065_t:CDS:2 [Entrophospora sp. SA101]|nr:10065_t:CDS:2 [Entrophospora sp. SA101]CAJ0833058.1 9310_t:CDS:2 [Entrophospora sp. SA101]